MCLLTFECFQHDRMTSKPAEAMPSVPSHLQRYWQPSLPNMPSNDLRVACPDAANKARPVDCIKQILFAREKNNKERHKVSSFAGFAFKKLVYLHSTSCCLTTVLLLKASVCLNKEAKFNNNLYGTHSNFG